MVQKIGSRRNETAPSKFLSFSIIQQQQQQPQRPKRFMGVRQSPSGRWVAEIKCTIQKIRLWLGTFDTPEEAARAYDEAACLLRGANTRTNFWPRATYGFGKYGDSNSRPSPVLSVKVLNHLHNHLEAQKATKGPQHSSSEPSKSSLLQPPLPQHQQRQHKPNQESELITKMAYGKLSSDVSTSSANTLSGDEREYSVTYENNIPYEMEGKVEVERVLNMMDMDLRLKEFSYFFTSCELEWRERVEINTYNEYDVFLLV